MKKIVGAIAIIAGLLMLSACSPNGGLDEGSTNSGRGDLYDVVNISIDGKIVPCVFTNRGGVSCKWN